MLILYISRLHKPSHQLHSLSQRLNTQITSSTAGQPPEYPFHLHRMPIIPASKLLTITTFKLHEICSNIFQMAISCDDKFLITCSDDGIICIWRLLNIEGKTIQLDKDFKQSSEILISKHDLEERIALIKNLQVRMHELQTEHAYQMRQNDIVNSLRMKDIHEGYCSAIEELKEKNEVSRYFH